MKVVIKLIIFLLNFVNFFTRFSYNNYFNFVFVDSNY